MYFTQFSCNRSNKSLKIYFILKLSTKSLIDLKISNSFSEVRHQTNIQHSFKAACFLKSYLQSRKLLVEQLKYLSGSDSIIGSGDTVCLRS